MVTSFKHYNDVMDRRAASVRRRAAVRFLYFPRAGAGKNKGNPDLVCEKKGTR